ncbi:hypothetical protein HYH02_004014 [Chlamydomonas schloesseri]|uniref:Uncharacterized protein n=1 Tax=Chlamydomonas schloesseri TaxID=2026947 RepID=A0A836B9J0_9CHLO|nr:hypothetical protein HYH02_004014 [Chlamydomonas schloesseri]|eukprot:KAG2451415.1 hypothetical protein HYH02_004014 [Chlamydomonas schloesseri]
MVALHEQYFGAAAQPINDSVTAEFNQQYALAKMKVSMKMLAEKSVKKDAGGFSAGKRAGKGRFGDAGQGGGRGNGRPAAPAAPAAAAAAGGGAGR